MDGSQEQPCASAGGQGQCEGRQAQRGPCWRAMQKHGDFSYMITRDKYKDTLFLISENINDMLYGGGTAQLRLQCYGHVADDERPAATGIPTGWCSAGGFPAMNAQVKFAIDLSFERILVQLSTWDYEYILFLRHRRPWIARRRIVSYNAW